MKSLKDFKNEIAKKEGLGDWDDLCIDDIQDKLHDQAAERFAEYREDECRDGQGHLIEVKFEEGYKKGWNAALKWAAEHAERTLDNVHFYVERKDILKGLK